MTNSKTSELLHKALKANFGYSEFRAGQLEIINSILNRQHTLAVMPTGGGKSLCYQIPAIVSEGTCIVVSPLIALMKDQVDALTKNNIPAALINSTLTDDELNLTFEMARIGKYKLLYIAPERISSNRFLSLLGDMKVSFLAVDEAHCISEWGHDFRPAYNNIVSITEILKNIPIIALTATATPEVQLDILKALGINSAQRFIRGFDRPNLKYFAEMAKNKAERVAEIIKSAPQGSHIIYCGSRKKVEKMNAELAQLDIKTLYYHAGLDDKYRKQTQDSFFKTKDSIIIATNAFGMGIDKPNVRTVIHTDLTGTLEGYYQEAGRAGRDGKESRCYVLYHPSDRFLQEYFIESTYPSKSDIEKVYNCLFDMTGCGVGYKPNVPLIADEFAIASAAQVPATMVISILKLLDRHDIAAKSSHSTSNTIQFCVSPMQVKEYLETLDFTRAEVLESLLRFLSSEAFSNPVDFDVHSFLVKYRIKQNDLSACLRSFVFSGIISQSQSGQSEGIVFNSYRSDINQCGIDFDELQKRKEYAKKKLDIVENYVLTEQCKRNYILNYFGENDVDAECGECSSCKGSKLSAKRVHEKDLKNVVSAIYSSEGQFAKSVIIDLLLGERSKSVNAFRLDTNELFGVYQKSGTEFVNQIISQAVKSGYIIYGEDKYHKLEVTDKGLEFISAFQTANPAKNEDKNITKTEMYQKLYALRDNIANLHKCQTRSIMSDKVLREVAKFKPRNAKEFSKIEGISMFFIEKYADYFIDAVNKIINNQNDRPIISEFLETLYFDLKEKLPINTLLTKHKLSESDFSRYYAQLIESGVDLPYTNYVKKELLEEIIDLIVKNKNISLRELRKAISTANEFYEIRMAYSVAKRILQERNN